MGPRRVTSRAAVRADAGIVLVALTLTAAARSATAGAVGVSTAAVVGVLGLAGVTGRSPMFPMLRSAIGKLRSWRATRRQEGRIALMSDDPGSL